MAVRLFIGNLPYGASEADLRAHFSAVAEPSHVVMPVDRETGRPRGFAFVEFVDRAAAEEVVKRFDAQPFQGRNLAVSEARAREDRPPRPPGGGASAPRPGGRRIRGSADSAAVGRIRRPTARRRRLRRPASWRVRASDRSRRPRPQRQLRPARAAQAAARRQEGQLAAGKQTARPDQGKERRPHLRRGRSGRRRAHRPRRRRDKRSRRR